MYEPDTDLIEQLLPVFPEDGLARAALRWLAAHPNDVTPAKDDRILRYCQSRSETALAQKIRKEVQRLRIEPPLPKAQLRALSTAYFATRFGNYASEYTSCDIALCAYVRHQRSSYHAMLRSFGTHLGRNREGLTLYQNLKVYVCARVCNLYTLQCDPRRAAFKRQPWPERFAGMEYRGIETGCALLLGLHEHPTEN